MYVYVVYVLYYKLGKGLHVVPEPMSHGYSNFE